MAATKWQVYHNAKKYMVDGTIDLDTATIVMKILADSKAAAVSAFTRDTFASLTHLTGFKSSATRALTSKSLRLSSNSILCFDAAPTIFTASAGVSSIQYAVIGITGGKAIAWCKLTATPISLAASNTLTITPAATGFFTFSGGTTA